MTLLAPPRRHDIATSLALLVATFLLTRQTQLPGLNGSAAPWALLMLLVLARPTPVMPTLLPMVVYTAASLVHGLVAGHPAADTLRFGLILLGTLAAFCCMPRPVHAGLALAPVGVQALGIVGVAVVLGAMQDPVAAAGLRAMSLESGWGDIYTFNGYYYYVQVIGNALLPLLFMVGLWRWHDARAYRWATVAAAAGLVAAGNLTYFLTAALALVVRGWPYLVARRWPKLLAAVVATALLALSGPLLETLVASKFDGSDSSMGVRFDQVRVAVEHLGASPLRLLFGDGLGARFPDGRERDYSQHQYIELQVLYLLLQIGALGMATYLATLWALSQRLMSRDARWIFWLYMLAGLSNPYILDTNQIVATVLLVSLFPRQSTPSGSIRLPG